MMKYLQKKKKNLYIWNFEETPNFMYDQEEKEGRNTPPLNGFHKIISCNHHHIQY